MIESNLSKDRAAEIDANVHHVFRKHYINSVPCGYSLSDDGLWFFEYHVRVTWPRRMNADKIFDEIMTVFRERGVKKLSGHGFGYVGDGWWFFHFHVLPNLAE